MKTNGLPVKLALLVVSLLMQHALYAEAEKAAGGETKPRPSLALWDSGTSSADAIAPEALGTHEGWAQLAPGQDAPPNKGDVIVSNGHLAAVVRKQSPAIELYSMGENGSALWARLALLTAESVPAAKLDHISVVDNSKSSVCLECAYQTGKGTAVTAQFTLKKGDIVLEVNPGSGAAKMRIECASRFVVLPDFFADDIVINPRKMTPNTIEVPSDNFLLQMAGKGEAIVMSVFENKQQDVKITLSGEGDSRVAAASEIDFGVMDQLDAAAAKDGKKPSHKIWLAVLEGPQIWNSTDVKSSDAGKTLPLEWKMPLLATWRVDFTRPNQLTDSWEMLLPDKRGFIKSSWLGSGEDHLDANRKRWNTVLGDFKYPCWSDAEHNGFLQPLKNEKLSFEGPVVLYPIARVKQTPLDGYTVLDVMRNSLGVGPCEYILDLEGQQSEYKGRATCSSRDKLKDIYGKNQQKQKRTEVEKVLEDDLIFVKHIRGRIARYVEFGHKLREYLAEQKKAHPELSGFIDEMDNLAQEIDKHYAAREEMIKTPEYVAKMNDDFRKNVLDDDGPDALKKCKKYAEDLVEVGDNQDELSGECRYIVKNLRQRSAILMAADPRAAPIAAEIRVRTQEALRNPANHEGARH